MGTVRRGGLVAVALVEAVALVVAALVVVALAAVAPVEAGELILFLVVFVCLLVVPNSILSRKCCNFRHGLE